MAFAKNTRTGKFTSVPEHYIGHPVLGKNLILVTEEVQAAPKKEKINKLIDRFTAVSETKEEQPAPDNIKENEDIEDVN